MDQRNQIRTPLQIGRFVMHFDTVLSAYDNLVDACECRNKFRPRARRQDRFRRIEHDRNEPVGAGPQVGQAPGMRGSQGVEVPAHDNRTSVGCGDCLSDLRPSIQANQRNIQANSACARLTRSRTRTPFGQRIEHSAQSPQRAACIESGMVR